MSIELTPPDATRCQAERIEYNPFVMGGSTRRYVRCSNQPAYIATENKPGKDGLVGSMSLCPVCADELKNKMGAAFATLTLIKAEEQKMKTSLYYGGSR